MTSQYQKEILLNSSIVELWRNGKHLGPPLQSQALVPQVGFYKGQVLGDSQALPPPGDVGVQPLTLRKPHSAHKPDVLLRGQKEQERAEREVRWKIPKRERLQPPPPRISYSES
ncbi:hypothetical protein TNCV_1490751 [Trichonephila clavipes]|nr:hypothetical protein TNCV_1490751 [Trichonephila clavipes]